MLNILTSSVFYAVAVLCNPSFAESEEAYRSCFVIMSEASPHSDAATCERDRRTGVKAFSESELMDVVAPNGGFVNFVCHEMEDSVSKDDEQFRRSLIHLYGPFGQEASE